MEFEDACLGTLEKGRKGYPVPTTSFTCSLMSLPLSTPLAPVIGWAAVTEYWVP